ncbi:MAG: diguanylate cyclase [Acidimicrobiales bacterium]
MRSAEVPADEADRLAALRALAVLDTPPDPVHDRLARLASVALEAPIALVTLIDEDRQWVKARVGVDLESTPRDVAFCAHAIVEPDEGPFVVPDTAGDDRFHDNPFVVGEPHVRFYAGQPVRSPDGHRIGTLCVMDVVPRTLSDQQRSVLVELAALVEDQLAQPSLTGLIEELEASSGQRSFIFDTMQEGLLLHDQRGRIVEWNRATETILGLSGEVLAGRAVPGERWTVRHPDGTPWPDEDLPAMQVLRTGRAVRGAMVQITRPDGTGAWLRISSVPGHRPDGSRFSVTTFTDVSAELAGARALAQSEELRRATLDALDHGVLLLDLEGQALLANPAALRIVGWSAEELSQRWQSGAWIPELETGGTVALEDRPLVRVLETGEPVLDEVLSWERRRRARDRAGVGDPARLGRGRPAAAGHLRRRHRRAHRPATARCHLERGAGRAHRARRPGRRGPGQRGLRRPGGARSRRRGGPTGGGVPPPRRRARGRGRLRGLPSDGDAHPQPGPARGGRRRERAVARHHRLSDQPGRPSPVRGGHRRHDRTTSAGVRSPPLPPALRARQRHHLGGGGRRDPAVRLAVERAAARVPRWLPARLGRARVRAPRRPGGGQRRAAGAHRGHPCRGAVPGPRARRARRREAPGVRGGEPARRARRGRRGDHVARRVRAPAPLELLAHRATHDDLTGLANRTLFVDRLGGALARSARDGHRVAVCFVDLDDFKEVNDHHGHATGDELLVDVAGRLAAHVRAGDEVARIGGDEFLVLLDPVDDDAHALEAATRLVEVVTGHRHVGDAEVWSAATAGVALGRPGEDAATLMARADRALYRAKAAGKARAVLDEP